MYLVFLTVKVVSGKKETERFVDISNVLVVNVGVFRHVELIYLYSILLTFTIRPNVHLSMSRIVRDYKSFC